MTLDGGAVRQHTLTAVHTALESVFDRAVESTGEIEHRLDIAGRTVRVRFAGPALVDVVLNALRHLPHGDGDVALTVCVWDTASTGTRLPDSPLIPRVDELTHSPLFRNGELSFLLQQGDNALSLLDADRSIAYHCMPNALPSVHHLGAPLRVVLSWWLNTVRHHLVHSAAVGHNGRAVLLTGPSGSGKSTTALACARAGMSYLGDDYVVLAPAPFHVHSLYRSAKLDRAHLARHPALLPAPLDGSAADKALGFVDDNCLALPVQAVVLPRVMPEGRTELRPTTAGRALLALAPATVLQLPGDSETVLRAMRDLVASVPVFELWLGPDFDRAPAILSDLLEA
jgi:hypothetical protein